MDIKYLANEQIWQVNNPEIVQAIFLHGRPYVQLFSPISLSVTAFHNIFGKGMQTE